MRSPLMQTLMQASEQTGAPGAAGTIVSRDETIDEVVVGVQRLGNETPIKMGDKFHIGSNTKSMTAVICAILVNMGLLEWEMTPIDVFPNLHENILPKYRTITLEMLLKHMAGIYSYMDDEAEDYILPPLGDIPVVDQITSFSKWLLQELPPINKPGTEFSYSNAGYSIAAAMAEAVTGQTWAGLMEEYLFNPLGIKGIAGKGWPVKHDSTQPWGHIFRDGELIPHPPDDAYQLEEFLSPAGDVCLSISDYGKFLQMNLKGLHGGETILPSETIWKLHNHGKLGLGFGWGIVKLRTLENLGAFSTHAGSGGTFICVAGISHQMDLAVGIFTNFASSEFIDLTFKKIIAQNSSK